MTRLRGSVVATTRDGSPDDPLTSGLEAEGAQVLVWPTIGFAPAGDPEALRAAAREAHAFDWIVFTSARAVVPFVKHLLKSPPHARIAAVGEATAAALRASGCPATTVGEAGAEALAERLSRDHELSGRRILFPSGSKAGPTLEKALSAKGAEVVRVEAYVTRSAPPDAGIVCGDLARGVDVVTFTSPSAVASLADSLRMSWPDALAGLRVACIGPTTAAEARSRGLEHVEVADHPSVDALIELCAQLIVTG